MFIQSCNRFTNIFVPHINFRILNKILFNKNILKAYLSLPSLPQII